MNKCFITLVALAMIVGCAKKQPSELLIQAQSFFQPISSLQWDSLDPAKVDLGKHLYFDTRLSATGNVSCNSCHDLTTYGVDNKSFSSGDDGSLGGRNSPTVFHAALHSMQFWDGRAIDVEEQAAGPILNPVEHNIESEDQLVERIRKIDLYQDLFSKSYPVENPISFENLVNAIGAFERTLLPSGKFDAFLEGNESALSTQEKKGLATFIKSGCVTCHNGVVLGGQMFQKFGVYKNYWELTESDPIDEGVYGITDNEAQKYFFKVPGLRNIVHTAPYFHDGSVETLMYAVQIMAELQSNLKLDEQQVEDIVAFLNSLSSDIPQSVKKSPFIQ